MKLDREQLHTDMGLAAKTELGAFWPDVREYFESEHRKIIENLAMINRLLDLGQIDEEMAKSLKESQELVSRTLLLSVQGLTLIMIERALNAALDSIRESVNTVLDFELL
jgi:hypothetical protein